MVFLLLFDILDSPHTNWIYHYIKLRFMEFPDKDSEEWHTLNQPRQTTECTDGYGLINQTD